MPVITANWGISKMHLKYHRDRESVYTTVKSVDIINEFGGIDKLNTRSRRFFNIYLGSKY